MLDELTPLILTRSQLQTELSTLILAVSTKSAAIDQAQAEYKHLCRKKKELENALIKVDKDIMVMIGGK